MVVVAMAKFVTAKPIVKLRMTSEAAATSRATVQSTGTSKPAVTSTSTPMTRGLAGCSCEQEQQTKREYERHFPH
jgi:hypothetical protein